jgi:hypothetical protein
MPTLKDSRRRPFDIRAGTFYKERMRSRGLLIGAFCAACAGVRADQPFRPDPPVRDVAQLPATPPDPAVGVVYICPMDPDVRAHNPGSCRRCGMNMVAGIPDPVEFHLDVNVIPSSPQPQRAAVLDFRVHDPWKERPVPSYNVVHERLFHAFVVSEDLTFFEHGHPALVADGVFQYPIRFPKPGMYRILSDFYPSGATPQLTTQTVFVAGATESAGARITRDYSPKVAANMRVTLETIPALPTVGNRTQLRFTVDDAEGLQQYLGAWGHLLAVSDDLIDMMHEHPSRTDGAGQIEFAVVFPRPRPYRIWVQFQKHGIVNTVQFDVPVERLEEVAP